MGLVHSSSYSFLKQTSERKCGLKKKTQNVVVVAQVCSAVWHFSPTQEPKPSTISSSLSLTSAFTVDIAHERDLKVRFVQWERMQQIKTTVRWGTKYYERERVWGSLTVRRKNSEGSGQRDGPTKKHATERMVREKPREREVAGKWRGEWRRRIEGSEERNGRGEMGGREEMRETGCGLQWQEAAGCALRAKSSWRR